MSDPTYRTPDFSDGPALSEMAAKSFAETFAHAIDPAEMPPYLEKAYGADGDMQRDLADPAIDWRAAFQRDAAGAMAPIGYIKLSAMALPYDLPRDAMEVRQLYVAEQAKGTGVADTLMRWAIDTARARGAAALYLAVFDHNTRAMRFYSRFGFVKVGNYAFYTGAQAHDDAVWRLEL